MNILFTAYVIICILSSYFYDHVGLEPEPAYPETTRPACLSLPF